MPIDKASDTCKAACIKEIGIGVVWITHPIILLNTFVPNKECWESISIRYPNIDFSLKDLSCSQEDKIPHFMFPDQFLDRDPGIVIGQVKILDDSCDIIYMSCICYRLS